MLDLDFHPEITGKIHHVIYIPCRVLMFGPALLRAPCRTSRLTRDSLLLSLLTPQEQSKPGRVRLERRCPASSLDSLRPHCSHSTTKTALSSWYAIMYTNTQTFWTVRSLMFLKKSLLLSKPAFKYSKSSNIVKYFYYLK